MSLPLSLSLLFNNYKTPSYFFLHNSLIEILWFGGGNCCNDGRYLHHHNTCSIEYLVHLNEVGIVFIEYFKWDRAWGPMYQYPPPKSQYFNLYGPPLPQIMFISFSKLPKAYSNDLFKHSKLCSLGAALVFRLGANPTHILQLSAALDMSDTCSIPLIWSLLIFQNYFDTSAIHWSCRKIDWSWKWHPDMKKNHDPMILLR